VPSQTELLFELGLDEEVAGITHFCIHPDHQYRQKPKIGGTKKIKIAAIRELNPDLIIANKEENDKAQVETLKAEFPVWVSQVSDLPSALRMIESVGKLVGKTDKARQMAHDIRQGFEQLPAVDGLSTLYFIWRKPYMAVGGDTFIHYMLTRIGLENVLKTKTRYPELMPETIQQMNPELIMLSSEPYPFKEHHIRELQQIVPKATIRLVDGSMFSWYGSRMLKAVNYMETLCKALNTRLYNQ